LSLDEALGAARRFPAFGEAVPVFGGGEWFFMVFFEHTDGSRICQAQIWAYQSPNMGIHEAAIKIIQMISNI